MKILRPLSLAGLLSLGVLINSTLVTACEGKYTFVGVMKTNDNVVEIYSSENGPHYTVRNKSGKILATTIDRDELAQNFPQLEPLMTEGHAKTLDASLGIQQEKTSVLQIN